MGGGGGLKGGDIHICLEVSKQGGKSVNQVTKDLYLSQK